MEAALVTIISINGITSGPITVDVDKDGRTRYGTALAVFRSLSRRA